jgi:hypothetical protein
MAATGDRQLERIVAVLRAAREHGVDVDHHDFEHVRDEALAVADEDARRALAAITWEDVRRRL